MINGVVKGPFFRACDNTMDRGMVGMYCTLISGVHYCHTLTLSRTGLVPSPRKLFRIEEYVSHKTYLQRVQPRIVVILYRSEEGDVVIEIIR